MAKSKHTPKAKFSTRTIYQIKQGNVLKAKTIMTAKGIVTCFKEKH